MQLVKMSGSATVARSQHSHGLGGHSEGGAGPMKPSSIAYFPFCAEISKYEKLAKVGEGTFG